MLPPKLSWAKEQRNSDKSILTGYWPLIVYLKSTKLKKNKQKKPQCFFLRRLTIHSYFLLFLFPLKITLQYYFKQK